MNRAFPTGLVSGELLRNLAHDVRGHLSRLHLRLSLFDLPEAERDDALGELAQIDLSLRTHVDLVRDLPKREQETVGLRGIVEQVVAELPSPEGFQIQPSVDIQLRAWPEFIQGMVRALAANALGRGQPPMTIAGAVDATHWSVSVSHADSVGDRDSVIANDRRDVEARDFSRGVGLIAAERLATMLGGELQVSHSADRCTVGLRCPRA